MDQGISARLLVFSSVLPVAHPPARLKGQFLYSNLGPYKALGLASRCQPTLNHRPFANGGGFLFFPSDPEMLHRSTSHDDDPQTSITEEDDRGAFGFL